MITKNIKKKISSPLGVLKIVFFYKKFAYNPGTIIAEKNGKKFKKTISGVYVPVLNVGKWTRKS